MTRKVMKLNRLDLQNNLNKKYSIKILNCIDKGFSGDIKYEIIFSNRIKCVLRVNDIKFYKEKLKEFETVKLAFNQGVKCCEPLIVDKNDKLAISFIILTYIDGQSAENIIPNLSEDIQYQIGYEAGKQLKLLHTIDCPNSFDWASYRFSLYNKYYDMYKKSGIVYEYESRIDRFVNENIYIIRGVMPKLCHGDYHVGNIIIKDEKFNGIIDFKGFGYRDSIEDFYKMAVFSRRKSIPFCCGQVDGYNGGYPSSDFWRKYNIYAAMTCFLSILWGKNHSEELFQLRKELCDMVVADHNCFEEKIPLWYKARKKYR